MRFFSLKTGKIVKKIKTTFVNQNIAHDQGDNKFAALS